MSFEKPVTVRPEKFHPLRLPIPKLERGGAPFRWTLKREGGRIVLHPGKPGSDS